MKLAIVMSIIGLICLLVGLCMMTTRESTKRKDDYIFAMLSNGPGMECTKTKVNGKWQYKCERYWESILNEWRQKALMYHNAGLELLPDVKQDLIDQGMIPADGSIAPFKTERIN